MMPPFRAKLLLIALLCLLSGCQDPPETPDSADSGAATPAVAPQQPPSAPPAQQPKPTPVAEPQKPRRYQPSLILFTIDTLRADRLATYGYDKFPTSPMLDAFARKAVVFEQAYAPSPWTLPTMVSVMTSTFPCEHGTLAARDGLSPSLSPLAERLKLAGYTTLSLYGNDFVGDANGLNRGFDKMLATTRTNGGKIAGFLNKHGKTPFFLYVHNTEPHNPYHFAPLKIPGFPEVGQPVRDELERIYKGYRRATRTDYVAKTPLGTNDSTDDQDRFMGEWNDKAQEYSDLYDASVRYSDLLFGSMLKTLRDSGGLDRCVIVFISDHGEEFFEHGGWTHDQSVYEELLRVPLMIRFPSGKFGGQRIAAPVSLLDIMPTLSDYLRVPDLARDTRGRNLMPVIRGQMALDPGETPQIVGMRHNRMKYYRPWAEGRGDLNIAVRIGPYKGIWNADPDTVELFNLEADPGESRDIAGEQPDVTERVRMAARDWYEACAAGQFDPTEQKQPTDLENLRTLGYVD